MINSRKNPAKAGSLHLKSLAKLSMFSAIGNKVGLRTLFADQSFQKIPQEKVEEVLLEVHLFAGFPATIDAFIEFRKFKPRQARVKRISGIDNRQDRLRRGKRLCQQVYHINFNRLISRMDDLHPELAKWIIEDGYGRVLSRSGLTTLDREFVAIAALAVLGWERQLESHIRGAINIGAKQAHLLSLFGVISPYISKRRIRTMRAVVNCEEMA